MIKNYVPFSSPNKLMLDQSLWDKNYILHNCKWKRINLEKQEPTTHKLEPEIISDIIQVWCLPAEITETTDPLYRETHCAVKYSDKFMFEATITEQSDLHLILSTNVEIGPGSILYPRNKEKRWWRVQNRDGNIINATISDFEPDFS